MNKKLPKPTKTGFRRWVAAQPNTQTWDYTNINECPFAGYVHSLGYTDVTVGGFTWGSRTHGSHDIPTAIYCVLRRAHTAAVIITQPTLLALLKARR